MEAIMPEKDAVGLPRMNHSPLNLIHYKERGWVNVGDSRMVFFDVKQGFYQIRQLVEREVGENSNFVIFQAGIRGGYSFLVPMLKKGHILPNSTGFLEGVTHYSGAGFGDFKLIDLKWEEGWALIKCKNAIEGWAYVENHQIQGKTICDYTRGIFLAFMKATHKFAKTGFEDRLDCIETACIGRGDRFCEYIIAEREILKHQGFDLSKPRMSIQKQLKGMVKEKTQKIKKTSRFYENIIRNTPGAVFTLDPKGRILTTNPAHSKLLGLPKKKLIGVNFLKLSSTLPSHLRGYLEAGLRGEAFELTNFPVPAQSSGPSLYLTVKGIPFKDEDGRNNLLCIIEDTTEKTKNSKYVEQLKEYNESIVQSITNGIMVLDRSFNILTWNRGMENMLGVKAERVLGKSIKRVSEESMQAAFIEKCKQVMDSRNPLEEKGFKIKTKAKGTLTLNLKILPLFNERKEVTGVTVFHEDISEKEKMELKYKNLFDKARDGIFVTDLEGNFISLNEAAQKIFGHRDHIEGKKVYQFMTPPSRKLLRERVQDVACGKERESFELEMLSHEGMKIPVEISLAAIQEDQKATGLQIIMRDIFERKRMEQQLIQASKMSAVGELASGVAHEINNPLASVAGYAEDLMDKLNRKEELTWRELEEFPEHLNTIIEQVYRCKEITRNLLSFARNDPLRLIRTNLLDVIHKAIALVEFEAREKRIRIFKSFDKRSLEIVTDPSQLQQVFLNILKNALDAVGTSGQIRVSSHSDNGKVTVRISDNGRGIPPKDLENIFTPFFTTKPPGKGTGLGLAISYMILERLEGKIEVESEFGKGSTFLLTLPRK
jgi:PAS domain S-box-containing protein